MSFPRAPRGLWWRFIGLRSGCGTRSAQRRHPCVDSSSFRRSICMPYTYTLSTVIPASPAEVYEAWLDSIAHAEMTGGGEAVISDEVGAEISALDGHITGRNLELVAPERIVQTWRTAEFDDETEESIVTILLQVTKDGTLLTPEHSNVPDQYKSYEEGGWQPHYFDPMIAYFSEFEEDLLD